MSRTPTPTSVLVDLPVEDGPTLTSLSHRKQRFTVVKVQWKALLLDGVFDHHATAFGEDHDNRVIWDTDLEGDLPEWAPEMPEWFLAAVEDMVRGHLAAMENAS